MVDFFNVDLKDAGLVVCYLYPGAMERLKDKFEKDCEHWKTQALDGLARSVERSYMS